MTKQPTHGDIEAGRELALYVANEGDIYDARARPTIATLVKRVLKGDYDHEMAARAWRYMADDGARKYTREHDTADRGPFGCFSVPARNICARELADRYAEHIAYDAAEKIGPPVVVVTFSGWAHDVNGNKTARARVDDIPVGKRRIQTGGDGRCGNGVYAALERCGYLPRWYDVAEFDGREGGALSSPSPVVTVTLHRRAIVVGPWVTPAGDPAYL